MPRYACKLCIWEQQLYGERFRAPESWFETPDEWLAHAHSAHPEVDVRKDIPAWPFMLADAQGCAEGYLVNYHSVDPVTYQFTCFRCHATTLNPEEVKRLHCLCCDRVYTDYHVGLNR